MLKRPRIGQAVATIADCRCNCYISRHSDGVVVKIKEIDPPRTKPVRGILVVDKKNERDIRWHCDQCLRLLTRKEKRKAK